MSAFKPALCIGDSIKPLPAEYDIVGVTPAAGAVSTCKATNRVDGQVSSTEESRRQPRVIVSGKACNPTREVFKRQQFSEIGGSVDFAYALQGIRNEARVSGQSNLLALRAAYESESFLYSIAELYEKLLSSTDAGHLPEVTVARWTLQISQALIHCHDHGELFIMHHTCSTGMVCPVVVCLQVRKPLYVAVCA